MALVACPDCGREVSGRAPACPHCGAPIADASPERKKGDRVPYTDHEVAVLLSQKKRTSHVLHLLLSLLTAGVWVIVWILVAVSNSSENAKIDRKIVKGKKI